MDNTSEYRRGLKHGIPICTGYIAVSFAFGIAASNKGLTTLQAVIMSITNVTSAGQYASLDAIRDGVSLVEMAILQLIINLRYMLMSTALTQKLSPRTGILHRMAIAYGVTDEIFALSVLGKGELKPAYSYGLISISIFGWVLGTFLGAFAGQILPPLLIACLGLAIYGMFIAIIIPPARDNKAVLAVVISAMLFSCIMTFAPVLKSVKSGMRIIIVTLIISIAAAIIAPVGEEKDKNADVVEEDGEAEGNSSDSVEARDSDVIDNKKKEA
ncbi:Predicted branched-chain amino acid permease (azaleucine resistance) [Butyrivibrio fibrisolvens DSM 3071]|uniref:Predicted branched-chain amino acid permease (Azaleucine resistance) n=1 Tax=Butyrivibrio fibrisolvens DSM 3071 TaxID=1121131 RepID=A0A1M5ZMD5_BUTFI|nr:AzlC family ABC transporter permease [Butyrivibrio fibrisolvens]SHI25322.1 Predicted branched-chain amino acid permease (azaleucine resistance) [Butyrivibrio fibrisolvens DSM 3071]